MKLFTRYSRITLLANIAVFVVASIAFYFSIRYVLVQQIDEDLQIEEDEITAFVKEHNRLPESYSVSDQVISFAPARKLVQRNISTVKLVDREGGEAENYRQLTFGISAQEQVYQATVSKSLEGTSSLLHSILLVSISTILSILLVSAVINRVLLKKLWKPFFASLQAVKTFRVSKDQPLSLPTTKIDEFNVLNGTLESITQASRLEYLSLKTFSENASHEIQTPIAIIRSKMDLLIQDEQLTEGQSKALQSASNAVEKLTRLNGSLLLLAKIENRQYEEVQLVDLRKKLEEKLDDFKELWQAKSFSLQTNLQECEVYMNEELVDVLLNNLLSNATLHNREGGCISVDLSSLRLTVSNTSNAPALDKERLFQRFYKPTAGSSHTGLGLSIIKQICEASGFVPSYHYHQSVHNFSVFFQNEK